MELLQTTDPLILVLGTSLLVLLASLIIWLPLHNRNQQLREENIRLQSALEAEQRNAEEKQKTFETARTQFSDSFNALAAEALKHNSGEFLKLANENFKQLQQQSQHDLAQKEKAVENLVNPIRETLEKTER
ncbi:MAG: DNA recombination protein RmuC, partial [Gammaproteobacteria bacterium]|nr:DNA recombination protein RmuC [Gammaproteobacteria bacterium]MCW8958416.1 DNA recombination protein RmuC [Gammaproteobacteria bacterium]